MQRACEPETTLVVIIGASEFPDFPILSANAAFLHSRNRIRDYFLSQERFNLSESNLLDLFDDESSMEGLDFKISSFIAKRRIELSNIGRSLTDIIIYYVGHGSFNSEGSEYFLVLRKTREDFDYFSGYPIKALAQTLRSTAAGIRKYLILDSCFSAAAYASFMGTPLTVAKTQVSSLLPPTKGIHKGTALLCASGPKEPAKSPVGAKLTMFTEALVDVLESGKEANAPFLSLQDVGVLTQMLIHDRHHEDGVRPQVLCPDQAKGDVSLIPIFPNPGHQQDAVSINPIESHIPARPHDSYPPASPTASGWIRRVLRTRRITITVTILTAIAICSVVAFHSRIPVVYSPLDAPDDDLVSAAYLIWEGLVLSKSSLEPSVELPPLFPVKYSYELNGHIGEFTFLPSFGVYVERNSLPGIPPYFFRPVKYKDGFLTVMDDSRSIGVMLPENGGQCLISTAGAPYAPLYLLKILSRPTSVAHTRSNNALRISEPILHESISFIGRNERQTKEIKPTMGVDSSIIVSTFVVTKYKGEASENVEVVEKGPKKVILAMKLDAIRRALSVGDAYGVVRCSWQEVRGARQVGQPVQTDRETVNTGTENSTVKKIVRFEAIMGKEPEARTQVPTPSALYELTIPAINFVPARSHRVFKPNHPPFGDIINGLEPHNGVVRCVAGFDVNVPRAGEYFISLEYAGGDNRSVSIGVNGTDRGTISLPSNGGFTKEYQAWSQQVSIQLNSGLNLVDLVRDGAFPHLRTLKVVEKR